MAQIRLSDLPQINGLVDDYNQAMVEANRIDGIKSITFFLAERQYFATSEIETLVKATMRRYWLVEAKKNLDKLAAFGFDISGQMERLIKEGL